MTANGGGPRLSDRQRINWLRLIRTENVGTASFRTLINRFGSAEAAIGALPELAARGGATRPVRIPTVEEAESELEQAATAGAAIIAMGEAGYPPLLRRMENCPPMLTVRGEPRVFDLPAAAIVGARNASLAGVKMARKLALDLGRDGYAIVSGLARGIDTAAHEGALPSGTVAVLAGGIDQPYPPQNAALMDEIAGRGGAVVTEMPFGWEPRAKDFPRRNRIIAGLALGLVVVEAAERSGSLISARLAGEMGRLVFAVPGSPLDPRAGGSNRLLKDGAILVTEASDVARALRPISVARSTCRSRPRNRNASAMMRRWRRPPERWSWRRWGQRRRLSMTSSAIPAFQPRRYTWFCSSWTLPAGSNATQAALYRLYSPTPDGCSPRTMSLASI